MRGTDKIDAWVSLTLVFLFATLNAGNKGKESVSIRDQIEFEAI